MRTRRIWILLLALIFVAGCGDAERSEAPMSGPPVVMTTFFPLTWVVERIGGDFVKVRCPVPADADPGHWMPSDDVIAAYQAASLVVINGAGFERWVERVSLPTSRVLDTTAALKDRFLRYEEAVTHSHGPAGAHAHEGLDGHTWLDPVLLLAQAESVRDALTKLLPDGAVYFAEGFGGLAIELNAVHDRFGETTADYDGPALYANHPAYNYFARRYGLRIVNLDLDPSTPPSDEVVANIRALLAKEPGKILLWESEPDAAVATRLRDALGLESVVFTPCESADVAEDGEFAATMHENVQRLQAAFDGRR